MTSTAHTHPEPAARAHLRLVCEVPPPSATRRPVIELAALRKLARTLHETSPVPLHARVYVTLEAMIRTGELSPGELLPLVHPMTKFLHVSRSVVLPALRRLVDEGLLQYLPDTKQYLVSDAADEHHDATNIASLPARRWHSNHDNHEHDHLEHDHLEHDDHEYDDDQNQQVQGLCGHVRFGGGVRR